MEPGPSLLDNEQTRNKIQQSIEAARERPFSAELEDWLRDRWREEWRKKPPPTHLLAMARKEDVPVIRRYGEEYELYFEMFSILWMSGLFDEARASLGDRLPSFLGRSLSYDSVGGKFELCERFSRWDLWGSSESMTGLYEQIESVCRSPEPVNPAYFRRWMIVGEPGTEKREVAQAIHDLSDRGRFEAVACAGPSEDNRNAVERCQLGGTVFWDEIEKLPAKWHPALSQGEGGARFILGISDTAYEKARGTQGWLSELMSLAQPIFDIPPLTRRVLDIPLLVNQALLELEVTELCPVRHVMGGTLMAHCQKVKSQMEENSSASGRGDESVATMEWLRTEIRRWVQEFSPETRFPEVTEDLHDPTQKLATESTHGKQTEAKSIERFPFSSGLAWSEVTIEFISDDEIRIRARDQLKTYHYAQIGFWNEKTGNPIKLWEFLLLLALDEEISWDTNISSDMSTHAKSYVYQLRKRLKEIMRIDDDPFADYRKVKAYRPRFTLKDNRYGRDDEASPRSDFAWEDADEDIIDEDIRDIMEEDMNRKPPVKSHRRPPKKS